MKLRKKLDYPDNPVTVPAKLLADCIDVISDRINQLHKGKRPNPNIGKLETLWDKLSEAIESAD